MTRKENIDLSIESLTDEAKAKGIVGNGCCSA
jgi:hypothetical protein